MNIEKYFRARGDGRCPNLLSRWIWHCWERKKSLTGDFKSLLEEKCIVLTITQFIEKINKKISQKIHLLRRPNLTRPLFFCDGAPKSMLDWVLKIDLDILI